MHNLIAKTVGLTLVGLVAATAALAQPKGADAAQIIRDRFHGPYMEAEWHTRTATTLTDGFVLTSKTQDKVTHLFAELHTTSLDSSGNVTGSVDVSGHATGVAASFDELRLSGGSVSGAVAATRCTYDAAGNETGCADAGALNVAATWIANGDLQLGSEWEDQFHVPGTFVFIDRQNGKFRPATATGTIGDVSFDAASGGQFVDMGVANEMVLLVCPKGC